MPTKTHHRYCRGCGGSMSPDDKAVRVAPGHLINEDGIDIFEENGSIWGFMHYRCFLTAIGDPASILEMKPASISL